MKEKKSHISKRRASSETLDDILAESRLAEKKYQSKQTNLKLWIVLGILLLMNVLGMQHPSMADAPFLNDTTMHSSVYFFLVNLSFLSIVFATPLSFIPSKRKKLTQRFHRWFLICYITFCVFFTLAILLSLMASLT